MNNYQKAMKEIRLSDTQKEEILQNILAKDIQPVKKRNVWLKPSLALVMVVILAVLIMPKGMGKGSAAGGFASNNAPLAAPAVAPAEAARDVETKESPEYAAQESSPEAPVNDEMHFTTNITTNDFMTEAEEAEYDETEISGIAVMIDSSHKLARFTINDTEYEFTYDTDDDEVFQEELRKFIESIRGKENE